MRRLRRIEQEVDLADGVQNSGRPDADVPASQRREPLTSQARNEQTRDLRVLIVEVLVARTVGDVENFLSAVAHRARNAKGISHRKSIASRPDGVTNVSQSHALTTAPTTLGRPLAEEATGKDSANPASFVAYDWVAVTADDDRPS